MLLVDCWCHQHTISSGDEEVTADGGTASDSLRRRTRGTVGDVDNRADVREFLTSRRARVTPHEVGLPAGITRRRVPGLRRSEVAMLAGVSVEYYTRPERGVIAGASPEILDRVSTALDFDDAERAYVFNLARAASPDGRAATVSVRNRLRVLRAERGWSQADLAARLSVSRQTVNAIETGKYDPSLPLAFAIARTFRLAIEDVFRPDE